MDIMRVLSAPDLEVRKKTLNIALDLVTSRTVEEVCSLIIFESYGWSVGTCPGFSPICFTKKK